MNPLAFPQQAAQMDAQTMADYALPGRVLMERASLGVADVVAHICPPPARAAVVCGPGNNGGDGLAVARLLLGRGYGVTAYLAGDPSRYGADAAGNLAALRALGGQPQPWEPTCQTFDIVVDALLGVGLDREVRGRFADIIGWMNAQAAPVVAVDIPSGVEAARGQALGCAVQAAATVTFGCAKLGHWLYPGRALTGALTVVDIGIPQALLKQTGQGQITLEDVAAWLPPRRPDSHKGTYGHVAVLAGCAQYPGAGALCATASVRAGAGLVTWLYPKGVQPRASVEVMTQELAGGDGALGTADLPDVLAALKTASTLAIGPGLGRQPDTVRAVWDILRQSHLPRVVDADGLNAVATQTEKLCNVTPGVLTPHPAEMTRLMGMTVKEVVADPVACVRRLAGQTGFVALLKGATTVVASPDGKTALSTTGNAGMATGGSGDVLTGLIAALLAQGLPAFEAACAGAWMHGRAGDLAAARLGVDGLAAGDLPGAIGEVFRQVREVQANP